MTIRRTAALCALAAVGMLSTATTRGDAAPFLPVGSGTWGPSPNVGQSPGCKGVTTSTTDCQIFATSSYTPPPPMPPRTIETCNNATYVITTPVIIGTNFGCTTRFDGSLRLTGTGATVPVGQDPGIEIEVGVCAGLTLVGPTVTVTDGAAGSYTVPVRVVVTNSGWKFQGHLVSVDTSTTRVVVLNVAGTITPACKAVRARDGSVVVTFNGVYSGSYQFL